MVASYPFDDSAVHRTTGTVAPAIDVCTKSRKLLGGSNPGITQNQQIGISKDEQTQTMKKIYTSLNNTIIYLYLNVLTRYLQAHLVIQYLPRYYRLAT